MKFQAIYRASFYLMLTCATLVLSIDSTDDNPFAMLYPIAVGASSLLAFSTVDRNPRLSISRELANWLALATLVPSVMEWYHDENLLLLSAAHWLVYLQLVKMFLPKTVEDDWFLFLLGLVQVLVGGVMSQSDNVGIALFAWALLALWVLILFALHREALRMKVAPMGSASGVGADRSEPYQGLIDAPFLFSAVRVAAMTLALGGLIFLATPRRSTMGSSQSNGVTAKHLSGFDDEVKLGELGEILENDNPVMSIETVDLENSRITPDPDVEYRWRGVSLDRYEEGRWSRSRLKSGYNFGIVGRKREGRVVRQLIKMEPTDSGILFALRPAFYADAPDKRFIPELNVGDGSLFRADRRAVSFDYSVDSLEKFDQAQPGEQYPTLDYLARLTDMPAELRRKIRPIALEQTKGLNDGDAQGKAATLERYLRDSDQFHYTLQMARTDAGVDPVEDFLVNRKTGHCEYFASALTLLLRSIDIPTRMVNGFKGGDYNAISGLTTVRQKHAHSWVEALVGKDLEQRPLWATLDPTPADQRNASVAQVGGLASNFYQITDFVRYVWIFYVVGFNSERQDRFLYGPIRALILEAQRGFAIMGEGIRRFLHFPSVESFFSLRGFSVSFGALLLLVVLIRLGSWVVKRTIRRLAGPKVDDAPGMAGIYFYRRLLKLLGEYGLDRPPAETPREFARRAAIFLSGHGSGTEGVADVPAVVVDAFYQIRFGDHTIRDDDFERITARLDALEAHLHPAKP